MRIAALDLTEGVAAYWDRQLGTGLLGFYLIGSLAHGGFSARYSDIDVALIAEEPLADAAIQAMRQEAAVRAPDLAPKLSLFWADRGFSVGRFPPLDRADYLDHAKPLIERERVLPPRPALGEIRAYLAGAPFARWAEKCQDLAAMAALRAEDRKPYLRALLYPARLVYSWETGAMASNDAAVAFLRAHAPEGLDCGLVERALLCRQAGDAPDPLFAERRMLLAQRDACMRWLAQR